MSFTSDSVAGAPTFMRSKVDVRFAKDGGQVRRIATTAHHKPTGRFTSLKCGRSWEWEAMHERHLMWISEADAQVIDFVAQPLRMRFLDRKFAAAHGRRRSPEYIPDMMRRLADGNIEIIETKKTMNEVSDDPFYDAKLAYAREDLRKRDFTFRVMTAADDIDVEPLLSNARMICIDRFTRLTSLDRLRFAEALGRRGRTTYRGAVEALSENRDYWDMRARARLHAMIVRREAAVDITVAIVPETPVTLAPRRRHKPKDMPGHEEAAA